MYMVKFKTHDKINSINKAIIEYFQKNKTEKVCKPKDLMPILIKNEVFKKDYRQGLPLRKILRRLDIDNTIYQQIPSIKIERKTKYNYWYFINPNL